MLHGHCNLRCFNGTGILREFGDEQLLTSPLGKGLLKPYCKSSPPLAQFITESPSLKSIVRVGLLPPAVISTMVANTSPAERTVIVGLLAPG